MRVLTLALALEVCSGYAFRVCGNYCGPGWCDAKWEAEVDCDDTAATDGSCEDSCCKIHDTCCGHTTPTTGKASCNTAIVACLDKCGSSKPWCKDKLGIPISNKLIAEAMDIVEDWCCGAPCPKSNISSGVEELVAGDARAAWVAEQVEN